MALGEAVVDEHIRKWKAELDKPWYPYRTKWPDRLFHHSPLENAVSILRDGNLRSRLDPANRRTKDVAAAGVIDNRDEAHQFGRLYFRPKTPTQWHIEGIRRADECAYGEATHAPILYMMVFDARSILTKPGIRFSDRNMQLGNAEVGSGEDFFGEIPFAKVFHEGTTGGDRTIIDHRCAEVLVPSPLELSGTLQTVFCRTNAERQTLLYALGDQASQWKDKLVVSDDTLVFNRRYVFVEEVTLRSDGVTFQISPRYDRADISITLKVRNTKGETVVDFRRSKMPATPDPPSKRWWIERDLRNGKYEVELSLEGHMAFRAELTLGDKLI